MSTSAYAVSVSSTYSEARARYVLGKVKDELFAFAMRGLLAIDVANRWCEDLLYLLDQGATDHFEIQCRTPSGRRCGLGYDVDDSGALASDDESGGVDAYSLPVGTQLALAVALRSGLPHAAAVLSELERRGWGSGALLEGPAFRDRVYSRGGFGVQRSHLGTWEEP